MKKFRFSSGVVFISVVLLGLMLRLIWNPHQVIWSYDQARDSFVMRKLIETRHITILGPQTEFVGLSHGPLYYYLFAPLYAISQGEPYLPVIGMTLLTFSALIPLSLLAFKITKDKRAVIFTAVIYTFSYGFIEFARWLSNVSVAIPFVAWSYYFLYQILVERKNQLKYFLLLGLMVGLATQAEIFFISLAATFLISLIVAGEKSIISFLTYFGGIVLGLLPLVVAEIKFGFLGSRTFATEFLAGHQKETLDASANFSLYLNHLGLSTYQTLGGISNSMGLFLFILLLAGFMVIILKDRNRKALLIWFLTILISHSLLFTFKLVDAVFLDLGLMVLLILILAVGLNLVFQSNRLLFGLIMIVFLLFQTVLYRSYLIEGRPFGEYHFIQEPGTLSDKEEVVKKIYQYAQGRPFTFASIGTPFGVRTVWASIFELYSREHGVVVPKWYGYYANGYPGETILAPVDKPASLQIVVVESNISKLLPQTFIDQELSNQDNHTQVTSEIKVNDTRIQFRQPSKL